MFEYVSLRLRNVPQNPESVYEPFAREITKRLGDDLLSLLVYGSAASGDYIFGRSNINMAMVLKTVTVSQLKGISVPVEKWMVRGFAAPMIFSVSSFSGYSIAISSVPQCPLW